MLEATPRALCEELDAADEYRKRLCAAKDGMVSRYVGPYYDARTDCEEAPENFYHEYTSYLLPRLVYNNPRFNVRSRRMGPQQDVAKGIGHALNRWCVDKALRKTLVTAATDYLFSFTVLLTTHEAEEGELHPSYQEKWGDRVPHMPCVNTIDNGDFYFDPMARTPEGWRYAGHGFVRDLEDLIAEAEQDSDDWNLEAVQALAEQVGEARQRRLADRNLLAERGEVELIEVWVPEHFDEGEFESREDAEAEGYHGMIYTVSRYQSGSEESKIKETWLRKPFGFFGPRWGPYTYIGCYPVPGEAARLSPLVAVEAQTRATNRLAKAVQGGAEDFKTLGIVRSDDPKVVRKIKSAQHHSILGIANFESKDVGDLSVGGNHPQQIESLMMAKDRRDRNAGLGEAQRGATTSGATATETAVAANSSALRMDFILQQWADGVAQLGRTAAWYFYHDNRVLMPLGEDAAQDLGEPEGAELFYEGGDHDPKSGATFDDLELEIEPYSMERTDQGLKQHQMLQMFGPLPQLLQLMGMFPTGADWADILDMYGDAFNMPGLGQKVHPEEIAAQMGAQAAPGGSEGPLLSSTVGGPAGAPKPARGAGSGASPALPGNVAASPMTAGA
jgi:hypothetical protein